jgi:hypothetical protein
VAIDGDAGLDSIKYAIHYHLKALPYLDVSVTPLDKRSVGIIISIRANFELLIELGSPKHGWSQSFSKGICFVSSEIVSNMSGNTRSWNFARNHRTSTV